jgi:hypothetical protein
MLPPNSPHAAQQAEQIRSFTSLFSGSDNFSRAVSEDLSRQADEFERTAVIETLLAQRKIEEENP